MAKNKKQSYVENSSDHGTYVASTPRVQVNSHDPDILNMDDISYVSDDELFSKLSSYEATRGKMIAKGQDPYLWEIEIAYLRREVQIRRARRESHDRYMAEQARESTVDESSLPYPDFDNLKYVVFN